jgi:hypothetical protein
MLAYSLRESGKNCWQRLFMQKIDRPGVDFHQHVLGDQLIEIMAGGISLHRETPGSQLAVKTSLRLSGSKKSV